ncbi:hypothetical protein TWF569_010343 [Orbilia oligospora]|uniref:DNA polymerase delta subunit 3 n=1 Tax=Orbilia oligospora TaxID=2813651 RepID=A0A7C8NSX0_ORBOL|nr:hypothetical protein TWF103_000788 [Orbilia oligospora]KAF3099143.1 hypothetical protein TWF102_005550 [Orbilia oligospora]KAF3115557.1 hypothetical protein TWF706_005681 [Orbilia oligospora]KAF3126663.1 hypothetical protein TWF703_010345 [Orbilia oligospora]KAF3133951.1 hypothetical protein TWF569_010343 [Orbilia oligospora]
MSTDYSSFLAARVLNDNKLVTYRLLSRELKIHVNKAKEYLAAFHETENRKRQGSCHATYLVTGVPKPLVPTSRPRIDTDDDTYMESSPVPQATQNEDEEVVKTSSVILVTEEELEGVKESLKEITSIHIYSVEPGPIKDLLAISDASAELYSRFPSLNAAEKSKIYGTTLNKYVKKRDGAPPPPPPPQPTTSSTYVVPVKKEPISSAPPTTVSTTTSKETKKDVKKDFFGSIKAKDAQKTRQTSDSTSSSKAKVPLKRGQSDLMSSFSNAQPKKPKQPEKEKTPPPDFMDVDDDEPAEVEPIDEETRAAEKARQEEIRKKREADEEELRRMMDEEDDEPIVTEKANSDVEVADSPEEEEEEEETAATPMEELSEPAPSASAPGRRKAKRRVTKKVRSKDADGYIVTREVTEWEEYSEDDVPVPAKPAPKPNAFSAMKQAPSSQKGKKGAGEGGPKRDIASFFQRK